MEFKLPVASTLNDAEQLKQLMLTVEKQAKENILAEGIDDLAIEGTADEMKENKKKVKEVRSKLNKEIGVVDEKIKLLNAEVTKGIKNLKSLYKDKVKILYDNADKVLKDKIDKITELQLKENEDYSREYWSKKLAAEPLRLGVAYEDIPWDFKYDSSQTSIRKTCNKHFESVTSALLVIDTHEYKDKLEKLWKKHGYVLGDALVELQQQLISAQELVDAKLAKQAEVRMVREPVVEEPVAVKTIIAVGPVVEQLPAVEEIDDYFFRIEMTDTQLEKFVEYLSNEDIDFELVEQ